MTDAFGRYTDAERAKKIEDAWHLDIPQWLIAQGPDSDLARRLARNCETPDVDLSWVFPIIAAELIARRERNEPIFHGPNCPCTMCT